jgi:hypothetical protein
MIKSSVVIDELDEFVKRWNNGELILTTEAKTMIIDYTVHDIKNLFGKPKKLAKSLPDYLGWAIGAYQYIREEGYSPDLMDMAYQLLDVIQRARAWRLLIDTNQQISDYEKQIELLKEENARLRTLNTKLAEENKKLHNLLPSSTRLGDTEVGDVGKP